MKSLYSVKINIFSFGRIKKGNEKPTSWNLRFASLSGEKSQFAWSFLIACQLVWLTKFVYGYSQLPKVLPSQHRVRQKANIIHLVLDY